jgi:uncharacterized protein YcfJ
MTPQRLTGAKPVALRSAAMALVATTVLGACAFAPRGPSYPALPGSGKSLNQLHADDDYCRAYSRKLAEGNNNEADPAVAGAVAGTVLGAVAGAALGGRDGAAAGAGVGMLTGAMFGAEQSQYVGRDAQRRYDIAYTQCMYDFGHRVAVQASGRGSPPPAPPPGSAPPPSAAPAPTVSGRVPPPPPPPPR